MYFYRRTKGKLGESEVDTTFAPKKTEPVDLKKETEGKGQGKLPPSNKEPPKSIAKFISA